MNADVSMPRRMVTRCRWAMIAAFTVALVFLPRTGARAGEDPLDPLLPENPLDGGKLFVEKGCVRCHAVFGEGGKGGPDLGKSRLNQGFLEVAGVMWNHTPRMENEFRRLKLVRPTFTEEEIAKIIAFVYFLNYFDSPGSSERGALLFREKSCQRCHSVGGLGGQTGGSLDRYRRYANAVFISTAMWNKGQRMAEEMRRSGITRPLFEPGDVRDILAYIRAAAKPQPGEGQVFLPPGNPRNGRRLFQEKHCAGCHATRGSGWGAGPDLKAAELRESVSTIAGFQWNHGPSMWSMMERQGWAVPKFTEEEMSDIVTYLFFIQYVEAPGDAAVGRRLFVEKGCSACHGLAPEGTGEGPNVTEMKGFTSPAGVIAAMWNHASEMERMTWEKNVVWPMVKETEMADLVAFLLSASGGGQGE